MIRKIFLTLFLVQLVAYVTTVIGCITDGVVIGSFLGTDAMSAYGLATPKLQKPVPVSGSCLLPITPPMTGRNSISAV